MSKGKRRDAQPRQVAAFKKLARDLDCSESEAVFDSQLGRLGNASVPRKPVKKKRNPIKVALPED